MKRLGCACDWEGEKVVAFCGAHAEYVRRVEELSKPPDGIRDEDLYRVYLDGFIATSTKSSLMNFRSDAIKMKLAYALGCGDGADKPCLRTKYELIADVEYQLNDKGELKDDEKEEVVGTATHGDKPDRFPHEVESCGCIEECPIHGGK